MSEDLWIVGKIPNGCNPQEWEFIGVFDGRRKAENACLDGTYFVGPAYLNEAYPDEPVSWPGAYYPKS